MEEIKKYSGQNTKLMMRFFIAATLLAISASGFAFNIDDCYSEIDKDAEMAASKKMSAIQQTQIKSNGLNICGKKQDVEFDKEEIKRQIDYIDGIKKIHYSFCGSDPERIGRKRECDERQLEDEKKIKDLEPLYVRVGRKEKKILKLQEEYEKLINSKPLPNRKISPALKLKQDSADAIEKVKNAILESMKDPNSAQFRRITTNGAGVCGEVNAKNSMGGYVGFKKFINWDDNDEVTDFTFYEDKDPKVAEIMSMYCKEMANK